MTAAVALRSGRRAAEALMTDTCTVRRHGPAVVDPVTNRLTPSSTTIYTGRCRIRATSVETQSREVEQQLLVVQRFTLSLPYDASADVAVDDVVEISGQGITVRIAGPFAQTHATARRFPVEALK